MSPSRSILLRVAVAALLLASPVVDAAAAHAAGTVGRCSPGIGIGLEDSGRSKDPRARTYVVDHVQPGDRFSRRFFVCNGTREAIRLKLYAGPATIAGGAFTVVEGHTSSELTGWISVLPREVTVPPGERRSAIARFSVPESAAGASATPSCWLSYPPRRASGVAVASRVGVRVYLDVGGPKAPVSDYIIDSLQASRDVAGSPVVMALVHNTGKRALDMRGSLVLRDGPGGLSGGPFMAQLGTTLAPGDTEPVIVPLSKAIRGGPWTARLTLSSGQLERRAEARITFPDAAGQTAPPVKAKNLPLAKDRKILVPLAAGLIFLLALLLLVVGLITSRRKSRQ